jgi:lysozyme
MQLVVTVKTLNKRSSLPLNFSDKNIVGTVQQGFSFDGEEVQAVQNPALGKWFKDKNGSFYWGGGLAIVSPLLNVADTIVNKPINIPDDAKIGIDLSHHNIPNWDAIVQAGFSFAYIKISEGVGTQDMQAKTHAENAKKNGLKIGYYHFAHPDARNGGTVQTDAEAEAKYALGLIDGLTVPDLPLVLDLENENMPLNKTDFLFWIKTFLETIESTPGSSAPIIYSTKSYLESKLPSTHDLFEEHKLWIANYSQTDCAKIKCPAGCKDWAMWQYTESAVIGGNGKTDLNIMKDTSLFQ